MAAIGIPLYHMGISWYLHLRQCIIAWNSASTLSKSIWNLKVKMLIMKTVLRQCLVLDYIRVIRIENTCIRHWRVARKNIENNKRKSTIDLLRSTYGWVQSFESYHNTVTKQGKFKCLLGILIIGWNLETNERTRAVQFFSQT